MTDPRAKAEILQRIRAAVGTQPVVPGIPREYRHDAGYDAAQLRDLLVDRLEDYRAEVVPCGADEVPDAVLRVLSSHGAQQVVAPPVVVQRWFSPQQPGAAMRFTEDHPGFSAHDLAGFDAVVTGCAVAIAETGVIVLDGGELSGRRAVSLVPDVHVCVVRMDQVVGIPPQALARLDPAVPQTWIAGPSATSDIELSRVEGVHGPRTLAVVLAG